MCSPYINLIELQVAFTFGNLRLFKISITEVFIIIYFLIARGISQESRRQKDIL